MGVDNTWTETSAPMGIHPPSSSEETLSLFTNSSYSSRHSNSPTSPVHVESASQHFASNWDTKQSLHSHPEMPPPSELGNFGDQSTLSAELEPYSSTQDLQDDIKDPCGAPGVCGLRNLGNTCFMSAGIQCLSNTPTLLHFFLIGFQIENIPSESLTAQFSHLIQRLWSGQNKVVHPADFKHALGSTYPQFKDYRQHDCQEFLALLLDSLHEQLNAAHQSNGSKVEVKTQTVCLTSSSSPPCTPPKVLREKNELAVKMNTVSSSSHLHYFLKDSKTSNVNVAVEEDETNNMIKFDSDKYHRNDLTNKHQVAHPKHNLASTYDFENKTVSTKRLKETNLLQERSAGGGASGDGLDFKRIKLTDQNNCKVKSGAEESDNTESVVLGGLDNQKHSNNTVLSYVNGITKCVNEKPVKNEQNEVGQSSKDDSSNSICDPVVCKEDLQANEHWEKHLTLNQSVVVDSFLGQFKSTVICSECKHISVTHEPFMYLSVPLPHAMERQIKVMFVPAIEPVAVQYLVTVNKQDSVRQLGEAVISLRTSESYTLPPGATVVLAEGMENRISKILDDCVPLRQVNDRNRQIYAIEMLLPPSGCPTSSSNHQVSSSDDLDFSTYPLNDVLQPMEQQNDYWTPSPESESVLFPAKKPLVETCAVNPDVEMMSLPDSSVEDIHTAQWSYPLSSMSRKRSYISTTEVPSYEFESDSSPIGTWESHKMPSPLEPDFFAQKEPVEERREAEATYSLSSESSTQSASESSHPFGPNSQRKSYKTVSEQDDSKPGRPLYHGAELPSDGFENWNDVCSSSPRNELKSRMGFVGVSPDRGDESRQCAICLDEVNRDMKRHVGCDIILCDSCIENACKHLGSKEELDCPGCRKTVRYDQEFVRIDKLGDLKPAVRMLTVPVVFRVDTEGDGNNNQKTYELFGHPKVLKIPSILPAAKLHSAVRRIVHTDQPYCLLTVEAKGDRCSRCLFTNHCRGCPIPTDEEVTLSNADTIAVRFTEQIDSQTRQHESLKLQRLPDNKSLSLYDCLKAFSESELLDEHNPWFCPTCKKNQCATKTLSVCRYPDLLIVYLKRFVFHNGISTKLDNKVTYPLNNLTINPQSSHHKGEIIYDLYACVCHVGGVSAGHYTAYAKNAHNLEWYHFNDENVVRQKPQEDDYSNAYILFYQKRGGAFPDIHLQESMKTSINQIIDDLGSSIDSESVGKSNMVIDSEGVDGEGLMNIGG